MPPLTTGLSICSELVCINGVFSQVSLFAELFNEMLQRDFGVRIYKSLLSLPEKDKEKKSKKEERKDKKEEREDDIDEPKPKRRKSGDDKDKKDDRDERKVCNFQDSQQNLECLVTTFRWLGRPTPL